MNQLDRLILKGIKKRVANKKFTVKTKTFKHLDRKLPMKGLKHV